MTELKKRPPAATTTAADGDAQAPAPARKPTGKLTLSQIRNSPAYRKAVAAIEANPDSNEVLPDIPSPDPELAYLWMRAQLGNQDDERNVSQTMNSARVPYEYVRPDELPELSRVVQMRNMGQEPVIRVGDLVLVKTSVYLRQALLDEVENRANYQLKSFKDKANKFTYGGKNTMVEYEDSLSYLGADEV